MTAATESCVTKEHNVKPLFTFISAPFWDRPDQKASNVSAKLSTLGLLRYLQEMPTVRGCREIGPFLGEGGFYTRGRKGLHHLVFLFELAGELFGICFRILDPNRNVKFDGEPAPGM